MTLLGNCTKVLTFPILTALMPWKKTKTKTNSKFFLTFMSPPI